MEKELVASVDLGLGGGDIGGQGYQMEMLSLTREIRDAMVEMSRSTRYKGFFGGGEEDNIGAFDVAGGVIGAGLLSRLIPAIPIGPLAAVTAAVIGSAAVAIPISTFIDNWIEEKFGRETILPDNPNLNPEAQKANDERIQGLVSQQQAISSELNQYNYTGLTEDELERVYQLNTELGRIQNELQKIQNDELVETKQQKEDILALEKEYTELNELSSMIISENTAYLQSQDESTSNQLNNQRSITVELAKQYEYYKKINSEGGRASRTTYGGDRMGSSQAANLFGAGGVVSSDVRNALERQRLSNLTRRLAEAENNRIRGL